MAYISYTELERRIPQDQLIELVNDENRVTTAVDLSNAADACRVRLDGLIQSACDFADSFLVSTNLSLPIMNPPNMLKDVVTDIAAYNVYTRRPMDTPLSIVDRYKSAIQALKNIQSGVQALGVDPSVNVGMAAGHYMTDKIDADREYNPAKWETYR